MAPASTQHPADAEPDAADAAGHERDRTVQAEVHGTRANLPSTCLFQEGGVHGHQHVLRRWRRHRRHGRLPAGQRAAGAGLVRPRRRASATPGATRQTHVVVLRAEGRGFNAGVDIKEMQRTERLRRPDRRQPRAATPPSPPSTTARCRSIAAVQGFCLGGGIGLVGNADIVVASDDATFGLPEVDRGALGAATHLARLVPQHLMRALYFTASTVDAADACSTTARSIAVVPRAELDDAALDVARDDRGQGHPGHPRAPRRRSTASTSRRAPQLPLRAGLHLRAEPGRRGRRAPRTPSSSGKGGDDARQADDARRRRSAGAARRHDHRHRRLGIAPQADGAGPRDPALAGPRPHRRLLRRPGRRPAVRRRQGPRAGLRVRLARLDPVRPAVRPRPPERRASRCARWTRAWSSPACARPPSGCRSCRSAPASAPTCCTYNPEPADGPLALRRRRGAGRDARPEPRRGARPPQPGRRARQRRLPRPRPVLRRPVLPGRRSAGSSRASRSCRPPSSSPPPHRRRCCSTG